MPPKRSIRRAVLAVLLLSVGVPLAHAADGGQRVHRCVGQHGEIVFTGLPCKADPTNTGPDTAAPAPTDRCAASRDELRTRIAAAIARRDPNALAGLARWQGIGANAASAHLRTLRELVQRPLLAIDDDGDVGAEAADTGGAALRVRSGSGDTGGVREYTFGVSVVGGCYWLVW